MTVRPAAKLAWHRGRKCDGGACVEVAAQGQKVLVRNSGDPATMFQVSRDEWQEFVAGVKDGDFDGL